MHTMLSFFAVVGGLILLGAPGVVLGPFLLAVTTTLMRPWQAWAAAAFEAPPQERDAVQHS